MLGPWRCISTEKDYTCSGHGMCVLGRGVVAGGARREERLQAGSGEEGDVHLGFMRLELQRYVEAGGGNSMTESGSSEDLLDVGAVGARIGIIGGSVDAAVERAVVGARAVIERKRN